MKPANAPFNPEDVLACTPHGMRAISDPASALASGFREVLRAINGKRTIADLQAFLTHLDPLKIGIWLDDALRMDLVKITNPAAPVAAPAAAAPFEYNAYIERDAEVAALAADISRWVKQKPQSGVRARTADLTKTVNQATLVSGAALESLQTTGAFSSSGSLDIFIEGLAEPAPATPPPDLFPAFGGAKKVAMVVEDDIPELGTLAGLLGAAGYTIRAVATRKQFVDAMNGAEPPDIIFLKLESAVIDAFKTLDKVRQHPQLGKLPIIISSEQPSREQIAKSILLGATGWIVRPFTEEKIAASLSGALAGVA